MRQPFILIAEDDTDITFLINSVLKEINHNFNWLFFKNGEEILNYLHQENSDPALIITDLSMPKKNGMEVLSEVKKGANTNHIPVVIFSNSTCDLDIELAFENNCDGYYLKGDSYEDFKAVLEDIVGLTAILENINDYA